MGKGDALENLKEGIHELKGLVNQGVTFTTEEFSLLVSCLECLDRHIVGYISDKCLLDVKSSCSCEEDKKTD